MDDFLNDQLKGRTLCQFFVLAYSRSLSSKILHLGAIRINNVLRAI